MDRAWAHHSAIVDMMLYTPMLRRSEESPRSNTSTQAEWGDGQDTEETWNAGRSPNGPPFRSFEQSLCWYLETVGEVEWHQDFPWWTPRKRVHHEAIASNQTTEINLWNTCDHFLGGNPQKSSLGWVTSSMMSMASWTKSWKRPANFNAKLLLRGLLRRHSVKAVCWNFSRPHPEPMALTFPGWRRGRPAS